MHKLLFGQGVPGSRPFKMRFTPEVNGKVLCPIYVTNPAASCRETCADCVPPSNDQVNRRRTIPCCRMDLLNDPAPTTTPKAEGPDQMKSLLSSGSVSSGNRTSSPSAGKVVAGDEKTGTCRSCRWFEGEAFIIYGACRFDPAPTPVKPDNYCSHYLFDYRSVASGGGRDLHAPD